MFDGLGVDFSIVKLSGFTLRRIFALQICAKKFDVGEPRHWIELSLWMSLNKNRTRNRPQVTKQTFLLHFCLIFPPFCKCGYIISHSSFRWYVNKTLEFLYQPPHLNFWSGNFLSFDWDPSSVWFNQTDMSFYLFWRCQACYHWNKFNCQNKAQLRWYIVVWCRERHTLLNRHSAFTAANLSSFSSLSFIFVTCSTHYNYSVIKTYCSCRLDLR